MQYYLSYRDRYDEALAVNTKIRILLDEQDTRLSSDMPQRHSPPRRAMSTKDWPIMRAIAATVTSWIPGATPSSPPLTSAFADAEQAVQVPRPGSTATIVTSWIPKKPNGTRPLSPICKARQHAALNQPAEAMAWYQFAAALDPFYRQNPQYFYTHLVDVGAYAEAQTLIRTDKQGPIRADFWQGLIYQRQGRPEEAQHAWQKAIKTELPDDGDVDYLELVLSHYYLGDHEGIGLASVLRAINENPGFWGLFYLAGLGWAMRNDMVTARSDMELALIRRKSLAEGRLLARNWWQFCADLLDESKQAQLAEYFEDAQVQRD